MREEKVVVEGETVEGEVLERFPSRLTVNKVMRGGSIGTFTKKGAGTEVRFFLERELRSAKTQAGPPYPDPDPTRTRALTRAPTPSPTSTPTPTPFPSPTPTSDSSPYP